MSKRTKTTSVVKHAQVIIVNDASLACLKRLKEMVKAECTQSGAVVAFGPPSPSCGGPGDPCGPP
jgi:hypothetical protein